MDDKNPNWISALAANPAQALTLAGVLALGLTHGLDDGGEPASEIKLSEAQSADLAATAAAARECAIVVAAISAELEKVTKNVNDRNDESFVFLGEVAQYLQRLSEILSKTPPVPGPRLEEYVRKAMMRGYRGGE